MAVSAEQFAAELRAFDGRRQIVKALRRGLTRAVRPVIPKVRAHAKAILPASGGLGAWVASSRIGSRISYVGRGAGVRLSGGRKSIRDKSDLRRLDAGSVRHPTFGRRKGNAWHPQRVTPGWWSDPLSEDDQWVTAAETEVDAALDIIRRG